MSSYLNYYKLKQSIEVEHIEIGQTDLNITLKDFKFSNIFKYLKSLMMKVINVFNRLFNWIKNKILKLFKHNKFMNEIKTYSRLKQSGIFYKYSIEHDINVRLREILNNIAPDSLSISVENTTREYTDIDVVIESIRQAFRDYNPSLLKNLFDSHGNLFDVDRLITDSETVARNVYDEMKKLDINTRSFLRNKSLTYFLESSARIRAALNYRYNTSDGFKLNIRSVDELYKYVDNFDSIHDEVYKFYNKRENILKSEINRLNKDLDDFIEENKDHDNVSSLIDFKILHLKLDGYMTLLKITSTPINVVMFYLRLLRLISIDVKTNTGIIVNKLNHGNLYHVSTDDDLCGARTNGYGVMEPRLPKSGYSEFLPKRNCYSETVEGCLLGSVYDPDDSRHIPTTRYKGVVRGYIDLHLYEVITDSNTRYIDPIILHHQTRDGDRSGEIDIVTPTRIKYNGKIRVYINASIRKGIKGRYIGWEYI